MQMRAEHKTYEVYNIYNTGVLHGNKKNISDHPESGRIGNLSKIITLAFSNFNSPNR